MATCVLQTGRYALHCFAVFLFLFLFLSAIARINEEVSRVSLPHTPHPTPHTTHQPFPTSLLALDHLVEGPLCFGQM